MKGISKIKVGAMVSSIGMALSLQGGQRELGYVFAASMWLFLYFA